jgi:amidase
MKVVKKENVIYDFSSQNKPIASVKLCEDFWVETEDFYGGQIKTEKDLRPNIDISIMFASTGPIEIENIM